MFKFKSLAIIALAAFTMSACSSSKNEVEQGSEQELFNSAQTYLQDANYSQAIRYLEAVQNRFPANNYGEQAQLDLIYAYYKSQDYTATLTAADRFLQQYPNSSHLDYVLYMAGLTNSALGDNMIQDFFGVDRSTRETSSVRNALGNFTTLAQHFPNSPYAADANARVRYLLDRLARHELKVAEFYAKRNAHVAVANRVAGMVKNYPNAKATNDALPLMLEAYEKMGLKDLAAQTQQLINANQSKQFADVEKPQEPNMDKK